MHGFCLGFGGKAKGNFLPFSLRCNAPNYNRLLGILNVEKGNLSKHEYVLEKHTTNKPTWKIFCGRACPILFLQEEGTRIRGKGYGKADFGAEPRIP